MKLYVTWEDGDGHKLLIPKEDYDNFLKEVENLEVLIRSLRKHASEESIEKAEGYECELWSYLDSFEKLEGEEHYVVLKSDLEE